MSYFGESNMAGNHHHLHHQERTSSSSSAGSGPSARKSKKGNTSDKPKQPQRGLGVAQLEKIRLHSQMGCTFLPNPLHHLPYDSHPSHHQVQEDMRLQTAGGSYSTSPPSFSYSPSSSSPYPYPANQSSIMMTVTDLERANVRFGDHSHPISNANPSWHPGMVYESQHYAQPNMTRHFLNHHLEGPVDRRVKKGRSYSTGSSDPNSHSNGDSELDLELRLSL
ncbi:unnamed protein product [Cuscuta epithymum]|uniref:Uncharacterized protein n=1 Tax=Cuscuta epithymum TaxID=186058 RepID=A0AAV0CL25_9ASTE|nr:unnamed protein product [Cuscuta epithymum]CAH9121773.1 unnamed protein product [Cuscuta epithymum]